MECKICGASENHVIYNVKESMFGFNDVYPYFQCERCECLQIDAAPKELTKYYPRGYYSHKNPNVRKGALDHLKVLKNKMIVLDGLGTFTYLSGFVRPPLRALTRLKLNADSRVIDVGCGSGTLLRSMSGMGFRNLLGIDPYIEQDLEIGHGIRILKKSLEHVEGKWDVVMFHHSLEHILDQQKTLESANRMLVHGGKCVIRVPTVSSYAWRHYKENWVQIDAPRHFFLHSRESIRLLAAMKGFSVESISYDSTAFQFWGSELYTKGVTLVAPDRSGMATRDIYFSKKQIKSFEKKSKQLNLAGEGDQAAFILKKI